MNEYNNKYIEKELSTHLTDKEFDRLKRITNFFDSFSNEQIKRICFKKDIPFEYINLISEGIIIPEEKILKKLNI